MRKAHRSAVSLGALALACALLSGLAAPAGATAPAACGTPLSRAELTSIAALADTRTLRGADSLARLEDAVARHRTITKTLVRHRDWRGLFPIGLDAVEELAVMPRQRDPHGYLNRPYSQALSLDLLRRFLDNLHAEFSGGAVQPHWAHYFALARDCTQSRGRVAMAGYSAHLTVDLAYAAAAVGSTPDTARDYFTSVEGIARVSDPVIDRTRREYQADLGPLWQFYFVGAGVELLTGRGVAAREVTVWADLGANVVIYSNGLALQNPALRAATETEIGLLWRGLDLSFAVLAAIHAL